MERDLSAAVHVVLDLWREWNKMNAHLYERFVSLKSLGRKAEAKAALDSFIASFETPEEKQVWVFSFLEDEGYGHKVRHEIYENLVYPVLLDGYLKDEANSVAWLARTVENLWEIKSPHPALRGKGELALHKEAYGLAPDENMRIGLIKTLIRGFDYAQHEWPAGILCGTDGADIEQCQDILQDIDLARQLDSEKRYESYLSKFEAKVNEYTKRLRDRV